MKKQYSRRDLFRKFITKKTEDIDPLFEKALTKAETGRYKDDKYSFIRITDKLRLIKVLYEFGFEIKISNYQVNKKLNESKKH